MDKKEFEKWIADHPELEYVRTGVHAKYVPVGEYRVSYYNNRRGVGVKVAYRDSKDSKPYVMTYRLRQNAVDRRYGAESSIRLASPSKVQDDDPYVLLMAAVVDLAFIDVKTGKSLDQYTAKRFLLDVLPDLIGVTREKMENIIYYRLRGK